jgi:hypothetical protein
MASELYLELISELYMELAELYLELGSELALELTS